MGRALSEADLTGGHEEVQLDATSVKVHLTAATGRRREGEKPDADTRRGLGRSRDGLTSKLHAAVAQAGRRLWLVLTLGQRGDAPQAPARLQGLRPKHVLADAGQPCLLVSIRGADLAELP